ncbi:MAG: RNA polymerase sigma factor [Kangiellaceae bacterium]|nr:RNA polymerase sigma factor [Kangiellaceae bacterium]
MEPGVEQEQLHDEQERLLIERIALNRDKSALESLYVDYQSRLASLLYRIVNSKELTEDVYNEVMLTVWRKATSYNAKSKVSTWIFAIAYKTCIGRLRSEKRYSNSEPFSSEPAQEDATCEDLVSDVVFSDENRELIKRALADLSFEHRTTLELVYFAGYTYSEVGTITEVPETTVKTRVFYAKKRLKKMLDSHYVGEVTDEG